ncbi:MAG: glycosyltransferase family 2 protein [Candidatus Omnitrophica bacterium]|nr:glycosyltransferase family 2 protein [Candidatus Omnitrophota bacterium]
MSNGKSPRIIAVIPAFNESGKTAAVVRQMPKDIVQETLVVDDGSTDETPREVKAAGATVFSHESRKGIGIAIRTGLEYALKNNYDIAVVMAGNGKDKPAEIGKLVKPIIGNECDFVQGSRYITGGEKGKMPLHRLLFTQWYSCAVRLATGRRVTDATNGFRAYKTQVVSDPRINLYQDWLTEPLEYYLLLKVLKLGYRVKEVPVSKIYPQNTSYRQYTKVRPFVGWWLRLKPLFYLTFGIKK